MHRVANLTSCRYSNSCMIEMKQMFDKMARFSQKRCNMTVVQTLLFQHLFGKPIDGILLALDSLVLSLNDSQQICLIAFR